MATLLARDQERVDAVAPHVAERHGLDRSVGATGCHRLDPVLVYETVGLVISQSFDPSSSPWTERFVPAPDRCVI